MERREEGDMEEEESADGMGGAGGTCKSPLSELLASGLLHRYIYKNKNKIKKLQKQNQNETNQSLVVSDLLHKYIHKN